MDQVRFLRLDDHLAAMIEDEAKAVDNAASNQGLGTEHRYHGLH